jgi:hypothetical protein
MAESYALEAFKQSLSWSAIRAPLPSTRPYVVQEAEARLKRWPHVDTDGSICYYAREISRSVHLLASFPGLRGFAERRISRSLERQARFSRFLCSMLGWCRLIADAVHVCAACLCRATVQGV